VFTEHVVDSTFVDDNWSREWAPFMKDMSFDRGGRPYYVSRSLCDDDGHALTCKWCLPLLVLLQVPVGFSRIGLKVQDFDRRFGDWHVAFHGLRSDATVKAILASGGLKTPTQVGIEPPIRHISLGETVFDIDNFADAVFLSPSYKYRFVRRVMLRFALPSYCVIDE